MGTIILAVISLVVAFIISLIGLAVIAVVVAALIHFYLVQHNAQDPAVCHL